jgi:hypothetical protein
MKTTALWTLTVLLAASTQAADIAWVTFHSGDNTPAQGAIDSGFSTAPDIGYTSLLTGAGYNVTRFVTKDDPTALDADFLNSFDLVIIGRSINSGNYQQANETLFWNSTITSPVMIMSGYALRNVRLGYTTGGTIPDTAANIALTVNNPAHPIFAGIALDGANTTVNPYAGIVTYDSTTARGISVNTDPIAGGGTVLATVGTAGDPAFGGMIIGEWQEGAVMNTGNVLGGDRLVFLSGSREANGVNSATAGILDLTADGQQMFLNAVAYMVVPEPSAFALLGLGACALFFRRRSA